MISVRRPEVVTRHRDGLIHAYVLQSGVLGVLEPAAVFRPRPGDEVVESAVRPDLERVVYTTPNSVVCLTRAGDLAWTPDFEPHSDRHHGHRPGCALSQDGRTVWVYRPDAMAQRGGADQGVVHNADTGAILARQEFETVGHGAHHYVHPMDGSVYLDIGEGQDGSVILRGTIGAHGEAEFVTYPWSDRCLIGPAPDVHQFMTVDHGQADVAFHRHPSGEVLFTLGGEGEGEEEWFRYHLVDVRTGTLGGEMAVEVDDPYRLEPLGDGSWLTDAPDTDPVRRACDPPPSSPPHPEG
ncbi:hypothetical protein PV392_01750 [Streptomyces sp. ME03-5709C]|nr:hypothetical protein [Streptomyces sp. ME03-5709C]